MTAFVAGQVLTAAALNAAIDAAFPLGIGAWTAYVPTLTQSVAVTKTIEYARYMKVGKTVFVEYSLAPTSSGTAANPVVVGFPAGLTPVPFRVLGGIGALFDASAGLWYTGAPIVSGAGFAAQGSGGGGPLGQSVMTAAITTSDVVAGGICYETSV